MSLGKKQEEYIKKLEEENKRLKNRFGLVWKDTPEEFVKEYKEDLIVGDKHFIYYKDFENKKELKKEGFKLKRNSTNYYLKDGIEYYYYSYKLYMFKEVVNNEDYIPILKEKGSDFFVGNNEDNILIEGDNYYALQMLQYTHKGKVDVIYIDPPYNTGKKDFKYNDKFLKTGDLDKHSSWLSFMKKRLVLAKKLLSDKGVIYLSIDDTECYNLKLLMDTVFGEENFIANLIRRTSYGPKKAKTRIDKHHEYTLCYAKKIDSISLIGDEKLFENYKNPDNDENGDWIKDSILIEMDNGRTGVNAKYPITNPYLNITHYPPLEKRKQWHYTKKKFDILLENNQVVFYKNKSDYKGEYSFFIKKYKKDILQKNDNIKSLGFTEKPFSNLRGTNQLKEFLSKDSFNNPKPIDLIKKILEYQNNKDALIIDFFAGSGTTGHAVWDLNKEDGGNRKFILCTNNENNICEDVTFERLKRANEKYEYNESLKYYKIEYIKKKENKK